jgi:TolB-like protein
MVYRRVIRKDEGDKMWAGMYDREVKEAMPRRCGNTIR